MLALNQPRVRIAGPWEKFDADGCLTGDAAQQELEALLVALADWTRWLRGE